MMASDVTGSGESDELNRLFQISKLANLNQRYYGRRAEKYVRLKLWLTVSGTSASAVALCLLLESPNPAREWVSGLIGVATVLSVLSPVTNWSAKAKRFSQLHFAYGGLFSDAGSVISKIRLEGYSPQCAGASEVVHETARRLQSQDESEPDGALIARESAKVDKRYPPPPKAAPPPPPRKERPPLL